MSQLSVTVRTNELTNMLTTIGASGQLRLHTGAIPANCGSARTGTTVATIALPATYFNAPSAGAATQAGTWSTSVATQGIIGYYTIFETTITTSHIQGTCGSAAWVVSTAYTIGQTRVNGGNTYQVVAGTSAASGGPTGTGAGIVDSGVTWNYLAAANASPDLTLDNINPVATSTLTITGATLTALGA